MYLTANYSEPGGRPYNEDSIRITQSPKGSLCMIAADGLGSYGGGDLASQCVCRIVADNWDGEACPHHLGSLLLQSHEEICKMQTAQCAMKSTAAVLAVQGAQAAWAYVGDTRIYHFYNQHLLGRTEDHSASQLAANMGQITQEQIRFHHERHRILRALGMEEALQVDVGQLELAHGQHAFLLCTDGFWEYVLEQEMEQTLQAASDPRQWLQAMRQILMGRIGPNSDNHSAAVMWLTQKEENGG